MKPTSNTKRLAVAALLALNFTLFTSCSKNEQNYDASGIFEATEVTVSAEQTGKLLEFNIQEGDKIAQNQQVGLIDTVQLWLTAKQIGATKLVYKSQLPEVSKQIATLNQQLRKAKQDEARFETLVKDGAANQKLLDDAKNQVEVLEKQIDALQSTLKNSTNSLNAQMGTADAQQLLVIDKLKKCHIQSPISGTVLEKYAEQGEFAATGKPLFKVADIQHLHLRAYITAAQFNGIKIGQEVKVLVDDANGGYKEYPGTITWISSKAEFTPKTIQTKDERANLVYAIKISVENKDELIKDGMYGEVRF